MRLRRQYLTKNACYTTGRTTDPVGVMWHSTGANNPRVARYVPGDGEMGRNALNNHWNTLHPGGKEMGPHPYTDREGKGRCDRCGGRLVCVHAFVGLFADGAVGTVQTLPWDWRGWHAGRSSGNDRYIGFELCEDGLEDRDYFEAVYREGVELTARLCREYGWDPMEEGVILCHAEGYGQGLASNHGDVLHWFERHGRTMEDVRADVAKYMEEDDMTYEQFKTYMLRYQEEREELPPSPWAEALLERAVEQGLTDGTRPRAWATRQEVALMVAAGREG